jgi:hypothetical protein
VKITIRLSEEQVIALVLAQHPDGEDLGSCLVRLANLPPLLCEETTSHQAVCEPTPDAECGDRTRQGIVEWMRNVGDSMSDCESLIGSGHALVWRNIADMIEKKQDLLPIHAQTHD